MIFINKYIALGVLFIIVGIILSPIYIGIPLMIIGFLIGDYGILYLIVKKIPGLDKKIMSLIDMIKKSYEPYFRKEVTRK